MIFNQSGSDKMFLNLALRNNMDLDKVISAYLITGDEFLILLHIFEGQTLNIPSDRRLGVANLHNIEFIEDDERKFRDYKKKEILEYNGVSYVVVNSEKKLLNHYYLPVLKESVVIEKEEEEVNGQ